MFISLWSDKDVSASGAGSKIYTFSVEEFSPELRYLGLKPANRFGERTSTILGRKIKFSLKDYFQKESGKIGWPSLDDYGKRRSYFLSFADYAIQKNSENENRLRHISAAMNSIKEIQENTVYNITLE